MGRTALLVANPAAGFRSVEPRAELAAKRLAGSGLRVELYRTVGPGDAERAAHEAVGRFDLVIAAGGDGTVHEVANGLARSQTPLGLVPLGSMNILARELGIPLDAGSACDWLVHAEPQPITLGLRTDRYFILMAGVGYDAFALEGAMSRAEREGRKVAFSDYLYTATIGARQYDFPKITAESSGFTAEGSFAIVANCPRYGANFRIANRARLEEPALDLVMFRRGAFLPRVGYFLSMLAGATAAAPGVVYRKLEEVAIRPLEAARVPCQLDGERSSPLPATFQAVASALHLLRRVAAK